MAGPVWLLSVDLQTKTATFTTGLADAAKAARGSFTDIKGGANEMGGRVNYSMMEARHGVMLLGENLEFHLPRALTSFITSIGPIGAAMQAAFPFLAIIGLATLLIEHLNKMREAGQKLTEDQERFGAAVNNAFNTLDQKLIQAQIKSDELKNDHLGALHHQLELIDRQSMAELVHAFTEVAKAADVVMKDLEGHWYTWGKGSEGAKSALDKFQAQYDLLLSSGKDADASKASGLLHGTAEQAQKVLTLLEQLQTAGRDNPFGKFADPAKFHEAEDALKKMGIAHGETVAKEIESQQNLVDVLNAQIGAEQRVADIKKLEGQNATTTAHKAMDKDAEAAARKQAEEQNRLDREYLQNFKHEQQDLVNVTREGTADRLEALRAAMDATAALYGQDNETYKQYAVEYIRTWNEMSTKTLEAVSKQLDEEDRLRAEAGRQAAENEQKDGERILAVHRQMVALEESTRRMSIARRMSDEIRAADMEYNLRQATIQKEIAALDKSGKDYENKLRALQDKEKQLTKQHEDDVTAIKTQAEIERNQRVLAAENQAASQVSGLLSRSIMGHQSWSQAIASSANQAVTSLMEAAIKYALVNDSEKRSKQLPPRVKHSWPGGIFLGRSTLLWHHSWAQRPLKQPWAL